jgi:two-component system response regulator ChvI
MQQSRTVELPSSPEPTPSSAFPTLAKLLYIDRDTIYRETLALELEELGFRVIPFSSGSDFISGINVAAEAEAILLDTCTATLGVDLILWIRRHGIKLPVLLLSRCNRVGDETKAFDHGAADFVDKSRGVDVLVQRLIRALKAASFEEGLGADRRIVLDELVLNRHVSRGSWKDVDLGLTSSEYKVAEILARNAGSFVSYQRIYESLSSPSAESRRCPEGYRTNVRSAIRRARNKFRSVDPAFDMIESYTTFGYRWRSTGRITGYDVCTQIPKRDTCRRGISDGTLGGSARLETRRRPKRPNALRKSLSAERVIP